MDIQVLAKSYTDVLPDRNHFMKHNDPPDPQLLDDIEYQPLFHSCTFPLDPRTSQWTTRTIADINDDATTDLGNIYSAAPVSGEAKARVQKMRQFLGTAATEGATLWRYVQAQKQAEARYATVAEDKKELDMMMKAWRDTNKPPPLQKKRYQGLRNGNSSGGASEDCPKLLDDILFWSSIIFVLKPQPPSVCDICGQYYSLWQGGRSMYMFLCGHYVHPLCFEQRHKEWMASPSAKEIPKPWKNKKLNEAEAVCANKNPEDPCGKCEGLKRLMRRMREDMLQARIRRVGNNALPWRKGFGGICDDLDIFVEDCELEAP